MISINLLPSEYRKSEATPIARFLSIVIGAVVVTTSLVVYGYVHYSQLRGAQRIGMPPSPGIAQGGDVVDVNAEANRLHARSSHGLRGGGHRTPSASRLARSSSSRRRRCL